MQNYVGQQIDRYRITERLGMGGMAVVYKAYDTRLERDVALKLIRTESIPQDQHERLFKRFEREAKAQARFKHPHIVAVHDYGEVDGSPYLVMDFISGGTLKDRLHGPVDWRQAIRWLIPVAEALSYAHKEGIIHRDVKPANILFDKDEQPILTDFGIAKVLETDEATLTGTGLGVGTPEYMAPEQWQGKTSAAADQYALGVVLYELITGRKPYSADTPAAVAIMQATEPLAPPSNLVSGIPEPVEKVLYKALARDPQDRFENMDAFTMVLRDLLADTGTQESEKPFEEIVTSAPDPTPAKPESSESGTRDALDTTPVEDLNASPKIKRMLPKWALWTGIVIIVLISIGLGIGVGGKKVNEGKGEGDLVTMLTTGSIHTSTPTQNLREENSLINENDGAMMEYIPAGEFLMGSNAIGTEDYETPEHLVYIDSFWIYKTEVTNEQFALFIEETGYETFAEKTNSSIVYENGEWVERTGAYWADPEGLRIGILGRDYYPVIQVSWYDANAYCEWAGGRLPTEAEWEKAARGDDVRTYPWGDILPNCLIANYFGCESSAKPVGSYLEGASPYNVLDLGGNVWEWVADWYDENYYEYSVNENPTGPENGSGRTVRGGSWLDIREGSRVTNRMAMHPDSTVYDIGFRCAAPIYP
ncbi:MAG: SUMF1/EgtB/PvdO family nonheme iron enzyme [Anaerolineaceae bacterium]|nr:SUMF1/EgtB/PvdO family nonheme iron enzyme [Anaerolineaceae bacterium]